MTALSYILTWSYLRFMLESMTALSYPLPGLIYRLSLSFKTMKNTYTQPETNIQVQTF